MAAFFRIVRTNPATEDDFLSDKARGLPPRNDEPLTLHVWDGISVYRTLAQAQRKARDYPFLGRFIAELDIDMDAQGSVSRRRSDAGITRCGEIQLCCSAPS